MTARQRLPRLTDRIALGRSGLLVSPVCLGIVGVPEVVATAFQAGINFFFLTADMHWPYYAQLREGLSRLLSSQPSVREQLVIAVVSYPTQPEFGVQPFYEVLEAVPELRRVDVAVIGGSYPSDFFARLSAHERNRPAGMRAIGATFHHRESAVTAVNRELLDVAFIRYNAAHAGAETDVFPHLRGDSSVPLFNFKSTAAYVPPERLDELAVPPDNWRPQRTDHYRFALSQSRVDGILCALGQVEHVAALEAALAAGPLSEEESDYLKKLAQLDSGEAEIDAGGGV
jgi:aryl-alcohol dehydrogenase-like predicted oxidoreductase